MYVVCKKGPIFSYPSVPLLLPLGDGKEWFYGQLGSVLFGKSVSLERMDPYTSSGPHTTQMVLVVVNGSIVCTRD